ncbi:TonB-dependent receptor [Pedobacter sp. PF22-3]|uniref:TonB-dependent receptor n=1 Tax=Pedobacter sp. PF22-3 TaxID=2994467 RepID=UPI0022479924|nr:TonB-dependent receptor [Pedobacter sp. PF22-3]MCX2492889.1 TonB-dependent receptor [Pedobacter sp. PF22-3]
MKVNAILLVILLFAVSSLYAVNSSAQSLQDVNVSLGFSKETLQKAFAKIEQQTDFRFAYKQEVISGIKVPQLSVKKRSVKQTLDELLQGSGLNYKLLNNSIIIFKEPVPLTPVNNLREEINGVVKDENGKGIPGVSVKVKGKTIAAITDNNGVFKIQCSADDNLIFSYIGYATVERPVQSAKSMEVFLEPQSGTLDAVVVIGYGTTTKRTNTGSVTTVGAKQIGNQPVGDPVAALQGRVAGLDISSVTGYPGSAYNVRLRGQNSITGGTAPLYIIDGVPFVSESLSQFAGANGNQSPLASINPADIEQIDILKDADATAIYGSRGANGVILITTKKGKSGKPEFTANIYSGISTVSKQVKMLDGAEYLAMRREAYAKDAVTPTEAQAPDLLLWDQNLDQNWQDLLIGNSASLSELQLGLSGGTEQTKYLISGTYRDEKIVLPGNLGFKRGALNMSLNHNSVDQKFQFTSSFKYTLDENNTLQSDVTSFFNLAPNFPIYDAQGNYYWIGNEQNPMAYFERTNVSNTNNIFGNTTVSYQFLKGLTAKVSAGFNRMDMKQTQTLPKLGFNPINYTGSSANYGSGNLSSYIVEPQLNYNIKVGKGSLSALVGGTWQHSLTEEQGVTGSGYISDLQLDNIKAATLITPRSYSYTKYRYTSVFGRLTYNWDEKYIVNGTFRRDGSSKFGPNNRFGNFGAMGAAWLFSNETFIKENLPFLSFGKLRGSFGTVGNDQIGDYQFLDSWTPTTYPYGGIGGISPSRFPNPNYSWEVNRKLEAGLDLGFFNERLLLTTNFYRNRSDNQLIGSTLSSQSGFTSYQANLPALVENKGWEFELSSINIREKDFSWNTSLNFTVAKTKLLEYPDLKNSANAARYVIGQPLSIVMGFDFLGINPQSGVPEFRDFNGDKVISDPADLIVIGNTMPKFYGGIQNSFTYKNFSFDFFFQFVKQEGPLLNYGYLSYSNGSALRNKDLSALERWITPGVPAMIPGASSTAGKPIYTAYQNNYRLSNAVWGDASFIRLKNVSLRYNFKDLLKSWKFNNITMYVQGQNLFTITSYDGFDPETKGYSMPPVSIYTAGLQVSF